MWIFETEKTPEKSAGRGAITIFRFVHGKGNYSQAGEAEQRHSHQSHFGLIERTVSKYRMSKELEIGHLLAFEVAIETN